MKSVNYTKQLEVVAEYDVIVAGSGPAGICAAVAAAREGAKVALIERYGVVGGNLTAGYVGPILGMVGKGTMRDELVELLGVP
ncbi:MAG: FAD-dependent oxidoreductase, partial [Alistipes sp.]|nr:FAD-dependent oxidoreductase [Alistipes sp.]